MEKRKAKQLKKSVKFFKDASGRRQQESYFPQVNLFSKISFVGEILQMMHAFGDSATPLNETAEMINNIVYKQMCAILTLAGEVAENRRSSSIGIEEIMFLLRKNVPKLFHFIHQLEFRDEKTKVCQYESLENDDFDKIVDSDNENEGLNTKKFKKRKTKCRNFLKRIDVSDNLVTMLGDDEGSEVRLQRLRRAEIQTRTMNTNEYLYYSECRQITFIKKLKKFQNWLHCVLSQLDFKPDTFGWEAVAYLAHETVSELVYFSLLVQADELSNDITTTTSVQSSFEDNLFSDQQKPPLTLFHINEALRRCSAASKINHLSSASQKLIAPFVGSLPIIAIL